MELTEKRHSIVCRALGPVWKSSFWWALLNLELYMWEDGSTQFVKFCQEQEETFLLVGMLSEMVTTRTTYGEPIFTCKSYRPNYSKIATCQFFQ